MQEQTFDIQELVKTSGVPRRTIYFYVQQGLLPAPEGAGLAAYYTRRHLVRLQLIPILRQQGLRLDEIRQRFGQLSTEELEQLLVDLQAGAPMNGQKASRAEEVSIHLAEAPPVYLPQPASAPLPKPFLRGEEGAAPAQRRYVHFQLPDGITLMAPDDLSLAEQQRLRQLLEAAAKIFAMPTYSE